MKVIGGLLIALALLVAIVPMFTDCASQGRSLTLANGREIPMKCHWTGLAELALTLAELEPKNVNLQIETTHLAPRNRHMPEAFRRRFMEPMRRAVKYARDDRESLQMQRQVADGAPSRDIGISLYDFAVSLRDSASKS